MGKAEFFLALALAGAPISAWSATGNDLRAWGDGFEKGGSFQNGVYMGYVSGVSNSFTGIGFCPPSNVTNGQSAAIVWKWLSAHPEVWNESGSSLVFAALAEAFPCAKK